MSALRLARRDRRGIGAVTMAIFAVGLALPLAACGVAHPGAAATVGHNRITVAELDAVVQRSLADPTFAKATPDRTALRADKLQTLIRDRLLIGALAEQHLTISEGDVQAMLKRVEQGNGQTAPRTDEELYTAVAHNGFARSDVHLVLFDLVAENELEAKITTPVVHAAHILVKDKATADDILAQVTADPSRFAALAKSDSIDSASAANGGDLGTAPATNYVGPFADATTKAAVGSYFEVQTTFGWHVVHLISRTDVTIADLVSQAKSQQEFDAATAILTSYLGDIGKKIGVSVNPRYGTWNDKTSEISPAPDAFSSTPPPRARTSSIPTSPVAPATPTPAASPASPAVASGS